MSDSSIQALNVAQTSLEVTANNIANISTDDFFPSRVDLETGRDGYGVQVADIVPSSNDVFGPDVVNHLGEDQIMSTTQVANNSVDLPHEIVDLVATENYFSANTQVIKSGQDMDRFLLDMIV